MRVQGSGFRVSDKISLGFYEVSLGLGARVQTWSPQSSKTRKIPRSLKTVHQTKEGAATCYLVRWDSLEG